jgi:DNA-binding NarL/FixJ family response regulator
MKKIIVVDDHAPTRTETIRLIGRESDLEVVAEAASGEEAVDVARTTRPDVAIMDILLPNMNGIEASRIIASELAGVRIVALTNHSGSALVNAFMAAGGSGYVRKDHAFEELIHAIRSALDGRRYFGIGVTASN